MGISLPAHVSNSKVHRKSIPRKGSPEPSDDDSSSSESSLPVIESTYDGACDFASCHNGSLTFGGDMAWDEPPPKQRRPGSINPYHSVHEHGPKTPGSIYERGRTRHRTGSQPNPAENQYSHNPSANQYEGGQNSGRSKDRIPPSNVTRYSRRGSVETDPDWRNRDVAPTPPAVVININHENKERTKRPRPTTQQEPITWDDPSEASSWASRKTPFNPEEYDDLAARIEKIKSGRWRAEFQGSKNKHSQQGNRQYSGGPAGKPGSRKSNHGEGGGQTQSAYKDNGRNTGYSQAESSTTEPPAMPGAWKSSLDQPQANFSNVVADNEQTQNVDNNWNSNEINDNAGDAGWGTVPNWDSSINPNQGPNQAWDSGENGNTHQNQWGHENNGNAGGSHTQNNQFQGNNHDQAHGWGKVGDNHAWTKPLQSNAGGNSETWTQRNRRRSKKSGFQGEAR